MTPSIPRLAREAIELSEKANLPWHHCAAGEARGEDCTCGLVWSKSADAVVLTMNDKDSDGHLGEGFTAEGKRRNKEYLIHAVNNYGTLARYVEDTAAIVEAAVAYSAAEQTANELAAQSCTVTEFSDAVRAQGDAYRTLMEKVRAYRAKGKGQNQ